MENAKSSQPASLKKDQHSPEPSDRKELPFVSSPAPDPFSVKTPGKRPGTPRQLRTRRAALSIKEIKKEALKIQEKLADPPAKIRLDLEFEKKRVVRKKIDSADSKASFPEKYELLAKFFNSLDSSIALLQLRRSSATFTNISSQIERLTDRRFTYCHLAQLKFIMPEVIVIHKVLRLDERTSCMKPELDINLDAKAIESKNSSKCPRSLQMRKVFRGRLLDFIQSHPEGDEVPEAVLPEPFGRLKEDVGENQAFPSISSQIPKSPAIMQSEQPTTAVHLSSSFKRHFSKPGPSLLSESTYTEHNVSVSSSGNKSRTISETSDSDLYLEPSAGGKCSSDKAETPLKHVYTKKTRGDQNSIGLACTPGTPVGIASMNATPARQPPKKCYMTPDDASFSTPSKLVRRPPAYRPLKFDTPVEVEEVDDKIGHSKKISPVDIFDCIPESTLQSIREKERVAAVANDPAISQAKWRRQMISCLPKLYNTVYSLFQSMRRSVITEEELIQKIISSHLDVLDRKEVEEQLRLLQELVPEWISVKTASTGDLLYCVNKISSPDAIRIRLSEAK